MKIETKFNVGENAVIINDNRIAIFPVHGITYTNRTIHYEFIVSKALSMMDKDKIIYRDEEDCFKSIDELVKYYES